MPLADKFHEISVLLRLLASVWMLLVVVLLFMTAADAIATVRFVSFVFIEYILAASGLVILQVLRRTTSSIALLIHY